MALISLALAALFLVDPTTPPPSSEDPHAPEKETTPRGTAEMPLPAVGESARERLPEAREEEPEAAAEELIPPVPLTSVEVPLPAGVASPEEVLLVRALLVVDEEGLVASVELLEGVGEPWDSAVLEAARGFRFEPARFQGVPVVVELPFDHRFLPPPEATDEGAPGPTARLHGRVVEKGSLRPLVGASLEIRIGDRTFHGRSGEEGAFEIETGVGDAEVEVTVTGYLRFVVRERLMDGEATEVRYLVERERYNPYEATVTGRAERREVSRTTLRDREIRQVPGTFGDPFRTIDTLPGVTQMMSLVSYPVVRGSNPGSTGILIDGIRVPQLFHYLAGPAVIHPAFIDRVDFYPGNFPVDYGGYTGGIVDGLTRSAGRDERMVDLGIDLTSASLFLRQPTLGATGTIAGRYGYPGMLLSAFGDDAYASYWDYQARLDGGRPSKGWTVFAFGSHDEAGPKTEYEGNTRIGSEFHRLDLRYREGSGRSLGLYRLTFGLDRLFGGDLNLYVWNAVPKVRWERPLSQALTLRVGADLTLRRTTTRLGPQENLGDFIPALNAFSGGFFTDTPLWIGDDFLLTPGFRVDAYETSSVRQVSFDPRLLWRYRLHENEESQSWLKGGVGIYHQPPRFPVPLPGMEEFSLDLGLGQSAQASLGGEVSLRQGYSLDVQGFFNYMSPIFLELAMFDDTSEPDFEDEEPSSSPLDGDLMRRGRSYGVEVLLRKQGPGLVFGWISYTLSRAERHDGARWSPYEFDRPHILNMVAGIQLPRNWELGGRFQVQGGRPHDGRRLAPYTRFDLRIDRRAVYNGWMLDFYIDLINVMVAPEPLDETETGKLRYLLPTVGFKAVL